MMIKIRSVSDVITNSSSEAFLIRTYGKTPAELKAEFEAFGDEACSGMGGELEVYNEVELTGEFGEGYENLPKDFAIVDIDSAKTSLRQHLFDHYWVVDAEEGYVRRDPATGRILGYVKKEESGEEAGHIMGVALQRFSCLDNLESLNGENYPATLEKVKAWYERAEKEDPDWFEEIKKSSGNTPEEHLERVRNYSEEFLKKYPDNPLDNYAYKY